MANQRRVERLRRPGSPGPGPALRPFSGFRAGRALATLATLVALGACQRPADVWLEGRTLAADARGVADDDAPGTPPDSFVLADSTLWAADSLTTAYADPPRPGRVSGGVSAEPTDTAHGDGPAGLAVARSLSRVTIPLDVREGGRVQLEVLLQLTDLELRASGAVVVSVGVEIRDSQDAPLPGGRLGPVRLEVRPDGSVITDDLPDEPDRVEPNASYSRTLTGPPGLHLDAGRYRTELSLAVEASAATRSGPGHLGRVGHVRATLASRR